MRGHEQRAFRVVGRVNFQAHDSRFQAPTNGFDDLLFLHKDLAYEVLWSIVRMLVRRLRETTDKLTFLTISGKF